jgi:Rap1a immunity proteins
MKRVALGFSLLLIFAFAKANAFGDEWAWEFGVDGNQLIAACAPAVQMLDEPSRKFTQQENYNIGYCHGFVSGIADSTQNDAEIMGLSRGQLVRVVQKYLVDHPEKLSLSSSFLVREALIKAFPKVRRGK